MRNFKTSVIIGILMFFSSQVFAQTTKGKVLIGGESSLEFSSTKDKMKDDNDEADGDKNLSIGFAPEVGYFVIDNFAVGAALLIDFSSAKDADDNKSTYTDMAIAPFARYYFGESNVKPYLHAQVGFGSAKNKYEPETGDSEETKYSLFTYGAGAGVGIFLNDNVSLDFGFQYNSTSLKPKEDNDTNFKYINSGFGLKLGIVVLL